MACIFHGEKHNKSMEKVCFKSGSVFFLNSGKSRFDRETVCSRQRETTQD